MAARTVLFVLFDDVQSIDVSGPLEVFAGANRRPGGPHYDIVTASLGGAPIVSSSGLRIVPDVDLDDAPAPHTLVVPGGLGTRTPDPLIVDWLRRNALRGDRLVSICTGALLLAEAGLLSGRRVTSHWSICSTLSRRFPDVDVDPDPIYVRDGTLATSAGVTAGIDLALALVEEDLGRQTALTIARHLVMFLRRPGNQAQFSTQLAAQLADQPRLREVQQWISDHPADDLSVEALARRTNLSPRQFARAFTAEVGQSPGRYVDAIRLETARRLLEDSDDSVERVGRRSGYGTTEAMRRAFVRTLGVSPGEYRRRF